MAIVSGYRALGRLVEALGLKGKPVKRIVLVFDVEEAVVAYVQCYVTGDEVRAVANLLEGFEPIIREVASVDVDEKGAVSVRED